MRKFGLFLLVFLTSCSSIVNVSSSSSGRQENLNDIVQKFHKDLYWKAYNKLADNISANYREKYINMVSKSCKSERVIEIEVENIDFFEDSKKAHVLIKIKSFKEPRYMVEDRREKETWSFISLDGGWLLESVESAH